jgi:hypothetical protein
VVGVADKFPTSLPEFRRMFPDDGACARYLESVRWREGFVCPRCEGTVEPMRLGRPGVLRCKGCKRDIALTAGTVMERTHTPLSTWFWAAFLVSSLTPGMSAVQLQRQLGLTRYETAHTLHGLLAAKLTRPRRKGMRGVLDVLGLGELLVKRGPKPASLAERFAAQVNLEGPTPEHCPEIGQCHLWTGARAARSGGYGAITVDGKTELAHRVAFLLAEGRLPKPCGLHRCDNRLCVRRDHIFEGSKKENTADMIAKKRGNQAKLTDADIVDVFARKARGESQHSIALAKGVSDSLVSAIVRGRPRVQRVHVSLQSPLLSP